MVDGLETFYGRDPNDAADLAFEFNTNDDSQSWTVTNVVNQNVLNGQYSGVSETGDPQIFNTTFSFAASSISGLRIKYRSNTNGPFQFFWGRQGADAFSGTRRLDLNYSGNGAWEYIEVDTSSIGAEWENQIITRMRIDPGNTAGAEWDIDWIRTNGQKDFATWIAGFEVGGLTGPGDDYDGDGIPNAVENYFGTDPGARSPGLAVIEMAVGGDGDTEFSFRHPMAADSASDLAVTYQWSKDLTLFHDDGQADADGTRVDFTHGNPVNGEVTVTATVSSPQTGRLFVRVAVGVMGD